MYSASKSPLRVDQPKNVYVLPFTVTCCPTVTSLLASAMGSEPYSTEMSAERLLPQVPLPS